MGSVAGKNHHRVYIRGAYHAGSWYENDWDELNATLERFLSAVVADGQDNSNSSSSSDHSQPQQRRRSLLRGLIVPHAGYSYSASTAAYAYVALKRELQNKLSPIKRILVLHPSHHVYLEGCAVSGASSLETPVGTLTVDDDLRNEILSLGKFTVMDKRVDEHEHSGEMQYPFLAKILGDTGRNNDNDDGVTVLPVMCGALSTEHETSFGRLLAEIVSRPDVVTVVSTDFCHWGSRFSYRPTPDKKAASSGSMKIYEYIEHMDRRGMDLIEMQRPGAFADYLKETRNTICGRHAVAVWLRAVTAASSSSSSSSNNNNEELKVNFVRYAQSSSAKSMHDSSVSYAAAVATTESYY